MNKILLLVLFIISANYTLNANSFSKSKKILLKKVYYDHKQTFYCKNPYEIRVKKGRQKALVIQDDKFYTPRNVYTKKGKINQRALRVEWEHIVPAHNFGKHLACWKKGGRKACRKDKVFKKMEADMMNLVPSIGEVNGDRSNLRYGFSSPKKGMYGNCNFQVDFKGRKAYIDESLRGFVARTYLYMSEKYKMKLSSRDKKQFKIWDKNYPKTSWEKTREKRISKYQ